MLPWIFTTYPDGSPLEIEAREELCDGRKYKLVFNLRAYESVIFEVPYTEEPQKKKKPAADGGGEVKKKPPVKKKPAAKKKTT